MSWIQKTSGLVIWCFCVVVSVMSPEPTWASAGIDAEAKKSSKDSEGVLSSNDEVEGVGSSKTVNLPRPAQESEAWFEWHRKGKKSSAKRRGDPHRNHQGLFAVIGAHRAAKQSGNLALLLPDEPMAGSDGAAGALKDRYCGDCCPIFSIDREARHHTRMLNLHA